MNINNYLENNLIAYIGNKRRLLPLIKKSIEKTGIDYNSDIKFLDLFAGSGSVSRLAKSMGFEVYSNDWEYYSYIINKAFLEFDNDFLLNSFKNFGGIENVINILNNLNTPKESDRYISKYYCPKNDDNPDINNERLFYTSYNGKKIDAIRAKIDEWAKKSEITENEETLLLALLLYEASTRSNTSGVFKGFHKGFGGTNGDALSRILKKIELNNPTLINGRKSYVFREDALELSYSLKNQKFDIVYLDPPYNQHQYGSNYHLLNTIALNDKPEINENILINGKKINKSAIRRDWIKTKSSFCYSKSAINDFKKIIENLNSRYILVSYSTDGIIHFDEMLSILSGKGKLDIVMSEYTKYRGGKQSLTTEIKNIEFILFVDTEKSSSKNDITDIQKTLLLNQIKLMSQKTINLSRLESRNFILKDISKNNISEYKVVKNYGAVSLELYISMNQMLNLNKIIETISEMDIETIKKIYDDIEFCTNLTKEDELYILISDIVKYYILNNFDLASETFSKIPYLLSKFNNKKAYISSLKAIERILNSIIQTKDIWIQSNFLESEDFTKLEKIILLKLNYSGSNTNEVIKQKQKIGELYDEIIGIFSEEKREINANSLQNVIKSRKSVSYLEKSVQ